MMKLSTLFAGVLCIAPACFADFNPQNMDTTAKPGVDFFEYADGNWMKTNTIPADHATLGTFDILNDDNERKLHAILEKAAAAKNPGEIERKVGDFYFSGMDLATVNAAGVTPIKGELDEINALASTADFGAEVAKLHMLGVDACFAFGSEPDPKDSDMTIVSPGQAGLGLPERDYYLRDDDASKKLRDQYVAHVAKLLGLAGDAPADAAAEAAAVMRIETALATGSKKQVDMRDPVANYHYVPLADVEKDMPHFNWNAYLAGMGLPRPASVDDGQPDFMKALDAEIAAAPLADWKAYFRWHLLHASARFLSEPFVDENFAFYGTTLAGTPKPRERWKRVLATVDGSIGEALGQLYVADNFPPEAKARALAMITNIRQALKERIQSLAWMDEPTRQAALRKLDAIRVKIGYPDKWIDYSTLVIDRSSYIQNVQRATVFLTKRDMAKVGKPVDKGEWQMTPPTVNAYYSPPGNEIVFPAGILQPPFFDDKADDAVNYGAIGSIMGHEMTHGFDDTGRQFDPKGNLTDWWTPESAARFKARSTAIVKQFSGYVAVDTLHVNGELSQGENIADLGGVKLSYTALEKTLAGKPAQKIDGFTPEQRFFLSFASNYRELDRPEVIRLYMQSDPHSPARFRVIGPLSNLDEFAKAFDVPEGAPMRRPAAERVDIW